MVVISKVHTNGGAVTMKLPDGPLFASTLLPNTVIFVFSSEKLTFSEFVPHSQSGAPPPSLPPACPQLHSGDEWSLEKVAGGYELRFHHIHFAFPSFWVLSCGGHQFIVLGDVCNASALLLN